MGEINIELIVPFIKSTMKVFQAMFGIAIERKKAYVKDGYAMYGDISGIIGLSGDTTGTCAVSLPENLAERVVSAMLGEPVTGGARNPDVRDGIGEVINMVAGGAKTLLSDSQYHFDITLPTLISGRGHEIFHRDGTYCVVVLFEADDGTPFTLDVAVSDSKRR